MMRVSKKGLLTFLIAFFPMLTFPQERENGVVPLYEGSRLIYDDQIGFEEFPLLISEDSVRITEGVLRRKWVSAPDDRSPLEIIRNYQVAIEELGGELLYVTRDPGSIEVDERKFSELFATHRRGRGLATNVMSYNHMPGGMSEFLTARIEGVDATHYLIVAAGKGHWAAQQAERTYYEIVTIREEGLALDKITMDAIDTGIDRYGRVPVYNILFETGSAEVRPESEEALVVISDFLNQHRFRTFLVVGHTDSVGGYEMNVELSYARANAVVEKLINEYGVERNQIRPVGVGPASPIFSNATDEGKARNRRVEIVEL